MSKNPRSKRHKARALLLQALYQWHYSGDEISNIEVQYMETEEYPKVDNAYFRELLFAIPKNTSDIDPIIEKYSALSLAEMSPVELSVLRLATYELIHKIEIPYRVVINEALELTKVYGSAEGYKFVNGVLDKIARSERSDEITSQKD